MALLTIPSIAAQREVGTNIILTTSEFRDCQPVDNGTVMRTISCHHPITEHMEDKASINLKNYFYWIVNPFGLPGGATCLVQILRPLNRNYTYSINLMLEYAINSSNQSWAVIQSDKFWRNITLIGLLAGVQGIDVDYDGDYSVTVYGQANNSMCSEAAFFTIDRTSEFIKRKATLVGIIIIGLFGIALYILYLSRYLADHFKPLVYSMSFLFAYSALSITALAEREYIKVITLNSNLGNIITMTINAATLIAMIMLVFFIANMLLKARTWKKEKEEL